MFSDHFTECEVFHLTSTEWLIDISIFVYWTSLCVWNGMSYVPLLKQSRWKTKEDGVEEPGVFFKWKTFAEKYISLSEGSVYDNKIGYCDIKRAGEIILSTVQIVPYICL